MTSVSAVIGRDAELTALEEFLGAEDELPGAFVLEGDAGIGKTTLWRAGLAAARAHDYQVLACSPSGAEAGLPYGALADLLEGAEKAVASLPEPQRRALNVALLVEEAWRDGPDPRATAAGFLNAVRYLARQSPVLLAVDDVQWLDGESASVLEFAVRRLRSEKVALLVARRGTAGTDALERALATERVRRSEIGPLTLGAIHELLKERLGTSFPRPVLHRLERASAGNPLFALELARALAGRGGSVAPGEELPVPRDLAALIDARISGLPRETIEALRAVSALAEPRLDVLAAYAHTDPLAALAPALAAHVVDLGDDGRVAFAHPLFASVVHAQLAPHERQLLHRRLAHVVGELEQRARHLALAAAGPDAEIAAQLDAAAERAAARGAPAAAAELMELAITLAPEESRPVFNRRRLRAADLHGLAGSRERSRILLGDLAQETPPGSDRARVLLRLAHYHEENLSEALALCERAVEEAAGDARIEGEVEQQLAFLHAFLGDLDAGRAHIRRAIALLEGSESNALADAIAGFVTLQVFAAEPVVEELLDRALALERRLGGPPRWRSPEKIAGLQHLYHGRVERARPFLENFAARAIAYGDESLHAHVLGHRVQLECHAGRFDVAGGLVAELAEVAEQIGWPHEATYPAALVAAYDGRDALAWRLARELAASAEADANVWNAAMADSICGFVELSRGDAAAAWRLLGSLPDRLEAMGYREIGWLPPLYMNAIEAAVGVGELERARVLVDRLERYSRRGGSSAGLIAGARGRGLLAAAEGVYEDAFAAFERSLAAEADAPAPFERARTLLWLGSAERRAKRWADARQSLEAATELFTRLGTPLWRERAREELARVPGRRPRGAVLTPTERRVAELVAEGRANKEVAAALFVTVKAVEANLSRVYAKLGVRSRTELAQRFASETGPKL